MKIKSEVITEIKKNTQLRNRLASAFKKTDFSVIRWIKENDANGPLTTFTALQIIREETGLNDEVILELEPDAVRA